MRILEARTGSLIEPTQEYIEALLAEIEQWKARIVIAQYEEKTPIKFDEEDIEEMSADHSDPMEIN